MLAMPLATEPRPAALPLPGGKSGATVRLHPILTGEIHAPPMYLERPSGSLARVKFLRQALGPRSGWVWLPVPAFLIEHPRAGPILIDTGLHPSVSTNVSANMGRAGRLIYEIRTDHDQALRFELPARGVQPAEIGVVIMTHLHTDHASAVSEFPAATFIVDGREWTAAAAGGARSGYNRRQFDHAFDWRTLDYRSELAESFAGFAQSLDLFGDGSVRLVATPGHTSGHQSAVLRTGDGEVIVIGDAAYTLRALRGGPLPFIVPDEHVYRRSLKEIRRYLEQTPDAVAIPSHDYEAWPNLSHVYG